MQLMLIAIKEFSNQGTKLLPSRRLELGLNQLIPTGSSTFKMHLSDTDPHGSFSAIHAEVFLTVFAPAMGIFTIEGWEWKLWKTAKVGLVVMDVWVGVWWKWVWVKWQMEVGWWRWARRRHTTHR